MCACLSHADGAVRTWTGGGADDNTSTAGNWGGVAPIANDDLVFAGTLRLTPNQVAALAVNSLSFSSGAGAFVIGGNTYTLGTGGVTNNSASTQTINNPLSLSAAQTWSATTANLVFGGAITNGGFGLFIDGSSNTTVTGAISGSGGLTKSGAGTLTLSVANSYSGTTTINSGTVAVVANALGTGGLVINGGALEITTGFSTARSISLGDTASTLRINASQTLAVTSAIAGTGSLNKSGAGTLTLSGANTYAGATLITAGTLSLTASGVIPDSSAVAVSGKLDIGGGGSTAINETIGSLSGSGVVDYSVTGGNRGGTLTVGTNNASTTFSGTLQNGVNTLALTKVGTGTLTLGGANTYGGTTTVNAGTLRLDSTGALGGGNLNVNGGVIGLGAANFTRAVGTGTGQVQLLNGGFAAYNGDRIVNLGGASATMTWGSTPGFLGAGATLMLGASDATHTVTFQNPINFGAANRTIQVNDGSAGVDASMTGVISGTGVLIKTGAGTLSLSGANTYSGGTTLDGGKVVIGASGLGSGALTINAATLQVTSSISTPHVVVLGAASSTVEIDAGQTATVHTTPISGSGSLNKTGAGTFVLAAANTYSGGTSLHAGTLQISASERIADNSALNVSGGTFDVQTFTETVGQVTLAGGSIIGAGTGTLSGSGYAMQAGTAGAILNGSGALTKSTSGTVTLSGANTFSGSTTVNDGTLHLASTSGSALASTSAVTVNSGGTLLLGANNQINNTAAVALGGGTFAKGNFSEGATGSAGVGALTLTAAGSRIDFGAGTVGTLSFASFAPGAFTLTIDNWSGTPNTVGTGSTDRLIFNSSQTANLSRFAFSGYTGAMQFDLGNGYYEVTAMTPVPEPGTYVAALLALASGLYHQRSRVLALRQHLPRRRR